MAFIDVLVCSYTQRVAYLAYNIPTKKYNKTRETECVYEKGVVEEDLCH